MCYQTDDDVYDPDNDTDEERCLSYVMFGTQECPHQEYLTSVSQWAATNREGDPWRMNW
jgi:hypothetical protein